MVWNNGKECISRKGAGAAGQRKVYTGFFVKNMDSILKYAVENGIIDLSYVQEKIEMNKRKEYLEKHPYSIWKGENDGKWYTYLPGEDGDRILRRRHTKSDIESVVVEYYRAIDERPCFREAYKRWIAEKEEFEEVGKNSITRYDNDFQRFFPADEPFCKIRLCDMTDSDLERFIKRTIKEKGLTAKSYAMLRLILNGVFKFSKREHYTDYSITNFFNDLSLPRNIFKKKIKDGEDEVFSKREVALLMNYFNKEDTSANMGLAIAFMTGVRVGELSSLKKVDNIKRGILSIRRTEITYKDKDIGKRLTVVKDYPKTDSGLRAIIIPEHAQEVLDKVKQKNPNGEYLFMKDGKRITERMFNYYLQKACKQVSILPRSTHKMRRTYGSNLLLNGVDESIVVGQMGHKDILTTQKYYHYDIEEDSERVKKINQAVSY